MEVREKWSTTGTAGTKDYLSGNLRVAADCADAANGNFFLCPDFLEIATNTLKTVPAGVSSFEMDLLPPAGPNVL